ECLLGAEDPSANGAANASPGQRPGFGVGNTFRAPKGRSKIRVLPQRSLHQFRLQPATGHGDFGKRFPNASAHSGYGTVHATAGGFDMETFVTLDLGGLVHLDRIDVFLGWNDSGRDDRSLNHPVS